MTSQPATCIHDVASQQLDDTGIRQTAADNQNQRDNNRGGMAETGKRGLFRHDACQQSDQQCAECNQVVTPAPPDQEHEYEKQQPE
jgi:hypothetical protein